MAAILALSRGAPLQAMDPLSGRNLAKAAGPAARLFECYVRDRHARIGFGLGKFLADGRRLARIGHAPCEPLCDAREGSGARANKNEVQSMNPL